MATYTTPLNRMAMKAADLAAPIIKFPNRIGPGVHTYARSRDQFIPASINCHTGQPHEHKREIARRQRQAERAKS